MKLPPMEVKNADIKEFLDKNIHRLNKPSTYLGTEINSRKIVWDGSKTNLILYMPVSYQAAINNIGVAILYNMLNDMDKDGVTCERGYMPEGMLRKAFIKKGISIGFSLESKHRLLDFDCVGFSCYFELQFLNIVYVLHYSGIPVYSKDRGEGREYPIIIMGGVAAYSPAAVEEIVDIVFIGDGEEQSAQFAKKLTCYKNNKQITKKDFLLDCAKTIPGCYVPRFYTFTYVGRWITSITATEPDLPNQITKACYDINRGDPFYKQILPATDGSLIGYGNVEIARGCYNSCRFCMASAIYKPYREYPLNKVEKSMDEAIGYLGCNDITPQSLNYSSYSQKHLLLKYMAKNLNKISTASQRMDTFSPVLAKTLYSRGTKTATFAIEGGSQRMRDIINKEITQNHIDTALKTLIDLNYKAVKIYMISGLPFETPDDRMEIINVLEPWAKYARKNARYLKIKLSYTQFTAKPFTALQWADVSDVLDTNSTTNWGDLGNIRTKARGIAQVKSSLEKADHIMLQLLNRVDRRFNDAIVDAVINKGLIYSGRLNTRTIVKDVDNANPKQKSKLRLKQFVCYLCSLCKRHTDVRVHGYFTEIPTDKLLPWDVLSTGVDKKWLIKEYGKAKSAISTTSCNKCPLCGVCTDESIKKQYNQPRPRYDTNTDITDKELADNIKSMRKSSTALNKLIIEVEIPQTPKESRFMESAVLKRQLILGFNSIGVYFDNVSLQSEDILYRSYLYGAELSIAQMQQNISFDDENDRKEVINAVNAKLNGTVKITRIWDSVNPNADTLKNIAEYALYKLELDDSLERKLKYTHTRIPTIIPTSPSKYKGYDKKRILKNARKKSRSKDVLKIHQMENIFDADNAPPDEQIRQFKVPLLKRATRGNSTFIYLICPLEVNAYYVISHILFGNNRQVVSLMRRPMERLEFIHQMETSLFGVCSKCGSPIETTDKYVPVANYKATSGDKLCISCLIDKGIL